MTAVARKLLIATLAAAALPLPAAARGAQYTIHSCGEAARYENHAFYGATSDGRMAARTICATDADGHTMGVGVLAGVTQGPVPVFSNATQTFMAPAGTTITHVHLRGEARTANRDWAALLQASSDRFSSNASDVAGCKPRAGDTRACTGASASVDQHYDLHGATSFRSVVACWNVAGCGTYVLPPWPFSRAYYLMHRVDLTLEDPLLPAASVIGGGLSEERWLRGSQGIVYGASDNTGISQTELAIDELGTIARAEHRCDYTWGVPCGNVNGATFSFDTSRVTDGPHRVAIGAVDATGVNKVTTSRSVFIDNHAPAEPANPVVEGGDGWHTTDDFTVRWTSPASASPVTHAFYEICGASDAACASGEQGGDGISRLAGLHVGQPGDYTIRVWLADAAGNVSNAKSAPLHLRFDNVPPGQAHPQRRAGWVNQSDARRFDQRIDPPDSQPASGIAGYAVTSDGADPGSSVTVPAAGDDGYVARAVLTDLPEGTTTVKARAISGAGVPSPQVGTAEIHVDLTAPRVTVDGAPSVHQWSRTPVSLRITATDPGELAGMASSLNPGDARSGGYVQAGLDQGDAGKWWGPQRELAPDGRLGHAATAAAELTVAGDGVHRLRYGASDAAGNLALEEATSFKIDRTPPELVVFEAQRRSDPRLIEVAASDRTSGLADGGVMRLRRVEPGEGPWITLATVRQGDRYYAHVENATLVAGDYELRATIPDQAGNEAEATRNRDGLTEILHISPTQVGPFPTPVGDGGAPHSDGPNPQDAQASVDTRLGAWLIERTVVRRKCKQRRKRCPKPAARELLVHDLRVGFGEAATARGVLTTTAGTPIRGAEITVLSRPGMAGGEYRATAVVLTDGGGAFGYRVPAGSSRTLDFHFRGDSKYKRADDQTTLRVPAAATLTVNRHSIRNGASVQFTGKLRGRPYPAKGKLLDLQAFYRNRWRTFATPRAARSGTWTYRYRFQATRGAVLYRFRIRVRATSDYPYEPGYSKTTQVRVRG